MLIEGRHTINKKEASGMKRSLFLCVHIGTTRYFVDSFVYLSFVVFEIFFDATIVELSLLLENICYLFQFVHFLYLHLQILLLFVQGKHCFVNGFSLTMEGRVIGGTIAVHNTFSLS